MSEAKISSPVVSVVLIAVAIVFFAIGRYSGGRPPVHVWPRGPIAIGASIDLKCGDTTYTVSTGDNQGECKTGPGAQNATCGSKGGGAKASCASGCMSSSGSGPVQ
jgi:hypothetical protein